MGSAIAERLQATGSLVAICDPDDFAAATFVEAGICRVDSAKEAADVAEVVVACLPTPEVSLEVALGKIGVIEGARVHTYVEMSTVGPNLVRTLDQALSARGVQVVDCPVSGGPRAARNGDLSLLVAGSDAAVAVLDGFFRALSSKLFHVGQEPGQAQVGKLVNNALSLVGMGLAAEAMVVGVKAGLNADALLAAINASTGRNGATLDKFPQAVLTRTFDYGGPLSAAVKDLSLFLGEAGNLEIAAPIVAAGLELWRRAAATGDPQRDFTRVVETVEQAAGVAIAGAAAGTSESWHV